MQYKNFENFVRTKRKEKGKSLNAFAFDCGLEPATLSNFERGKSDIMFRNFLKIAEGFHLPPSELLFEYENKKQ